MRQIYVLFLAVCASVICMAQEPLSGKFTVNAEGKQVQFAPGNLQYVPSTDTWQFAGSQTEIVGKDAAYVTANPGYGGAIDLFPWGDNYGAHIGEGWRLLTREEWEYIFREEEIGFGAENVGQATMGTQRGLMLTPDGWEPFATLSFAPSVNNWYSNEYTLENWIELEKSGVVFLPCANDVGDYWSATPNGEGSAYGIHFYETAILADASSSRSNSYAVRLVKDVKSTPTGVENVQRDNVQCTKVLRNGQIYLMYKGTMYNVQGKAVKR